MPIEALDNSNQIDQAGLVSEIVSQNQRFILGAKLESADFQFIPVDDVTAFNSLPEGAFFTDNNRAGLNRVGRKISGQRKYLAYEQELRAYVVDEIGKLKPIAVNPSVNPILPTSTSNRPIYAGQEIVFLTAGMVESRPVEAGGIAIALTDIPTGTKIEWSQLQYNGAGMQITPILLKDSIRLDGSAGNDGATEKAIADAIIAVRNLLQSAIQVVDGRLSTALQNLTNRVTAVESRTTLLEGKPNWLEESVLVGNGVAQLFKIPLHNKYLNTPVLIWSILSGSKYIRINDQDGEVVTEDGVQYLNAAFAGIPSVDLFRVSIQGLVAPVAPTT